MATKSRPKKSFRNFQKRKYGTAPTIIGQHESRRKLAIVPIQDRIFVSNAEQPGSEDYHLADGPNDGSLSLSDFVFEIGEVLVFRGTDGLLFDLLKDSLSTTMQRASKRRFRGPRNPKVLRRHLKAVEICLHPSHPSVEWIEIFL